MKRKLFNLILYCNTEFLQKVLDKKQSLIDFYAFAHHDKDVYMSDVLDDDGNLKHIKGELKVPHTHLVMMLKTWRDVKGIKKWFVSVDDNGNDTNVLYRDAKGTTVDCLLYLTHENAPDKVQYDKSVVVSYNVDWDDITKYASDDAPVDNTYDIVQDILSGVRTIDLIKKYGRDFVFHYQSFNLIVEKVRYDDNIDKAEHNKSGSVNQSDEYDYEDAKYKEHQENEDFARECRNGFKDCYNKNNPFNV